MLPVIGVIVVFILIITLRLKEVDISLSILVSSLILAVTSGNPLSNLFNAVLNTLADPIFWSLTVAVAMISALGYVLKESGLMMEFINSLQRMVPSRFLLSIIPALFGLFTMPGGALMSAPFNEPEARRLGLQPEQMTYINVWFRHLWYWASPISPVPILAASLAGFQLNQFLSSQIIVFAVVILIGLVVTTPFYKNSEPGVRVPQSMGNLVKVLAVIVTTIILSVIGLPTWAAITVGITMIIIFKRIPPREALRMTLKGISLKLAVAVGSMIFFRYIILETGSVNALLEVIIHLRIPILLIMILVPILIGVISGTPTMGIGIVFPLLLPLSGFSNIQLVSIIYVGVITGYIASPLHLCLILTNNYYKSKLRKVYRYLVPSAVMMYLVVLVYRLILNGAVPQ